MRNKYVPSAWDLPWHERAELNQMYADMAKEMEADVSAMTKTEFGPHNSPTQPPHNSAVERALQEVDAELYSALSKFGPFNSAHEGFSVLHEEVDELWDEVKAKQGARDIDKMRKEAVQVAAMAIRFILDVCYDGRGQK